MGKIGIIGVGSVGGAIASRIVALELTREIVLIDSDSARATAAAADLSHAAAFNATPIKIKAGGYKDLSGADIVIIAAGANQRPGETRADLAPKNAAVMIDVVPKIPTSKNTILIVVTNPLDAMVMAAQKLSALPAERVIGTGTMLDTARLRAILAARENVSPGDIHAFVLGEHGDSSFVWPGDMKLSAGEKARVQKQVRNAAYEIINGRGATWDGIAAAAADLVRCIMLDQRRVLPVSVGAPAFSLPRVVGRAGVVRTILPALSADEKSSMRTSIAAVKKTYKVVE